MSKKPFYDYQEQSKKTEQHTVTNSATWRIGNDTQPVQNSDDKGRLVRDCQNYVTACMRADLIAEFDYKRQITTNKVY